VDLLLFKQLLAHPPLLFLHCRCLWLGSFSDVAASSCELGPCAIWHYAGAVCCPVCLLFVQHFGRWEPSTQYNSCLIWPPASPLIVDVQL